MFTTKGFKYPETIPDGMPGGAEQPFAERVSEIERKLATAIQKAARREITMRELYQTGQELDDEMAGIDPEGWHGDNHYDGLRHILETVVFPLHDEHEREHYERNPEMLEVYAKALLRSHPDSSGE